MHLARGVDADYDPAVAYARQGNALLDGTYPSSEYPSGAVVLFGFEALIGEGSTRVSHALAMVPFQLSVVAAVWLVGTRSSRWFAAVIALWPLNAFFWEFKFGLVPTTFLVLGLVFASRERWLLAGALLGVGAATKWTPALTVLALVLWLLGSKRWRPAAAHAAGAAAAFLVVNIPFLVWSAREVHGAAAIATAGMVPVVFLTFNRVFSPQFLVLIAAAWAVAGSLLALNARAPTRARNPHLRSDALERPRVPDTLVGLGRLLRAALPVRACRYRLGVPRRFTRAVRYDLSGAANRAARRSRRMRLLT